MAGDGSPRRAPLLRREQHDALARALGLGDDGDGREAVVEAAAEALVGERAVAVELARRLLDDPRDDDAGPPRREPRAQGRRVDESRLEELVVGVHAPLEELS